MPYHIHKADELWSATADIQYHDVVSDEVVLHVFLEVDEAYHIHDGQQVWSVPIEGGDAPYHEIYTNNAVDISLIPHLTLSGEILRQYAGNLPTFAIAIPAVDDTWHLHRVDGPWHPEPVPNSTFHLLVDDMYREPGNELNLIADNPPSGNVEATLPILSGVGYGNYTADITLPSLEPTMTGTVGLVGSVSADLPMLEVKIRSGNNVWAKLPSLIVTASGYINHHGGVSATLPSMLGSGTGSNFGLGEVSATLPSLQCNATGILSIHGSVDITLPQLLLDSTGVVGIVGSVLDDLPFLRGDASGFIVSEGSVDADLPSLELIAVGTNNLARFCSNILSHTR